MIHNRRILEALTSNSYVFAKTMPQNPHWYTLRKNWADDVLFQACVQFIRDYGYAERFKGAEYICFNINSYKYWTMGAPINKEGKPHTILINRAKIEHHSPYDAIAESYEKYFKTNKYLAEDKELIDLIEIKPTDKILDVGCGAGLLLDHIKFTKKYENYIGLDISSKMLMLATKKHPNVELVNVDVADMYIPERNQPNKVVALYGVPNYLTDENIDNLIFNIHPLAELFFVIYAPEYKPETYKQFNIKPAGYKNKLVRNAYKLKPFGNNYRIFKGSVAEYENL